MKKWASLLIVLMIVGSFIFGCADMSKDAKVKCPKCGAIFTHMDEDADDVSPKP